MSAVKQIPLEEEYKKDTGITPQDISRLRDWVKTQPHLPADQLTDLDLILIYHCTERSAEVSKQVLDLQYTLRTLFTGFFKDRVVDTKIEQALNTVLMKPLSTRTKEGYACFYAHLLDSDTKNFVLADAIRTAVMIVDLWQYEEGTWPGFIVVLDLKGFSLGHLSKMDLQVIQQYFYYVQEAMLVKTKGLHFLNAPAFMDKIMFLIKPFIKQELMSIIHIHQAGSQTFENFYPKEGLPKDAGGNYKSFSECKDEMVSKLKANPEFFAQENSKRVVESKRPGKPKTVTDFFGGIEGSFKKLDID